MLGQAWRTMKQTLGNVHPKLAQVLAALATLKARQKKSVEAQQLLRRSIAIWRHMGAGSHPALLSALKMLTKLCSMQGKHHKALCNCSRNGHSHTPTCSYSLCDPLVACSMYAVTLLWCALYLMQLFL